MMIKTEDLNNKTLLDAGIHTYIWLEKLGFDIWMHDHILDSKVIHINT
jgi:hypothetical protein